MAIQRKTHDELEKMRAAGKIVGQILQQLGRMCEPGIRTQELEDLSASIIASSGGEPLFKNYPHFAGGAPYPATVCVSVNEEVVHGIPGDRVLTDGDIVSFDVGVRLNGWCGDAARSVIVGQGSAQAQRLVAVTAEALDLARETMRPGILWSAVASKMERHVKEAGFSVVTDFVGHGIGCQMHEDPKLPNFVSRELLRHDILLQEGMTFAVEPMVNMGGSRVRVLSDGWTVVTSDGKPSAHFEHTIAVVAGGSDVLTLP